uniref:Putative secreted protein n=1 Tax=Xenopsylla cheopis TaxID=163159 RepID=A0A6M2E2P0_XENCH
MMKYTLFWRFKLILFLVEITCLLQVKTVIQNLVIISFGVMVKVVMHQIIGKQQSMVLLGMSLLRETSITLVNSEMNMLI